MGIVAKSIQRNGVGWRIATHRHCGDKLQSNRMWKGFGTGRWVTSKKLQKRLHFMYSTFLYQESLSDILPVCEELLRCFLPVPEVSCPFRGRVRSAFAFPDGSKAFAIPAFTHQGPTSNINATSFPRRDLRPPWQVLPLITLSCLGVSAVRFIEEKPQTGQYLISPNEVKPFPFIWIMKPVLPSACAYRGASARMSVEPRVRGSIESKHLQGNSPGNTSAGKSSSRDVRVFKEECLEPQHVGSEVFSVCCPRFASDRKREDVEAGGDQRLWLWV